MWKLLEEPVCEVIEPSHLTSPRVTSLQACLPFPEPRMNNRTIGLAIRVVKSSLSDTRSKVTGQGPEGWDVGLCEVEACDLPWGPVGTVVLPETLLPSRT